LRRGRSLGTIFDKPGFFMSTNPWLSTSKDINDNLWHQIIGIWDGNSQFLYIDGVLVNQMAKNYANFSNKNITIGNCINDGSGFIGKIDDILIYNRALNKFEMDSLFHEGSTSIIEKIVNISNQNIYPNPVTDILKIENLTKLKYQTIEIYSIEGKLAFTQKLKFPQNSISISSLSSGIYILKVIDSKSFISYKFVKR
jgi:hypothetical protein